MIRVWIVAPQREMPTLHLGLRLFSGAEQGRANTDKGRTGLDSRFEIAAHPHGQLGQTDPVGQSLHFREIGTWVQPFGRNGHKPMDLQPPFLSALQDKGFDLVRGQAGLLGFLANIDLDIQARIAPLPLHLLSQRDSQTGTVQGLDRIKKGNGLPDLVGL